MLGHLEKLCVDKVNKQKFRGYFFNGLVFIEKICLYSIDEENFLNLKFI